jgi:hypothetical protein
MGVYVYSLPHYLRYPYDEQTGRTLLMVGQTNPSAMAARGTAPTIAWPEDEVLLRLYMCNDEDDAVNKQRTIQRLLLAAGHGWRAPAVGGPQWFLTSLRFTDEIAAALDLEVREVVDAYENC